MLLAGAVAIFATNVLPTSRTVSATERHLERLEALNAGREAHLDELERDADLLRNDPWTIERVLRDEYRMSGDREIVVR